LVRPLQVQANVGGRLHLKINLLECPAQKFWTPDLRGSIYSVHPLLPFLTCPNASIRLAFGGLKECQSTPTREISMSKAQNDIVGSSDIERRDVLRAASGAAIAGFAAGALMNTPALAQGGAPNVVASSANRNNGALGARLQGVQRGAAHNLA
jgi:hypothetical protein